VRRVPERKRGGEGGEGGAEKEGRRLNELMIMCLSALGLQRPRMEMILRMIGRMD